jgi:hypothetical protein
MSTPADTPTIIAKVTRTTDANHPEFASYDVTTTDGRVYTLSKEYYGDGPTMFDWITSGPDAYYDEAPTKKAALTRITHLPSPATQGDAQ